MHKKFAYNMMDAQFIPPEEFDQLQLPKEIGINKFFFRILSTRSEQKK